MDNLFLKAQANNLRFVNFKKHDNILYIFAAKRLKTDSKQKESNVVDMAAAIEREKVRHKSLQSIFFKNKVHVFFFFVLYSQEKRGRKRHWLTTDIVVRVMNKTVGDGEYYKKKGVVVKLIDK